MQSVVMIANKFAVGSGVGVGGDDVQQALDSGSGGGVCSRW